MKDEKEKRIIDQFGLGNAKRFDLLSLNFRQREHTNHREEQTISDMEADGFLSLLHPATGMQHLVQYPTIPALVFNPDFAPPEGKTGYLTRRTYDAKTKTLFLETSKGEEARLQIANDRVFGTVWQNSDGSRQTTELFDLPYEPDARRRKFLEEHNSGIRDALNQLNVESACLIYDGRNLSVILESETQGNHVVHNMPLSFPTGTRMELVDSGMTTYMLLTGKDFVDVHDVQKRTANSAIIALNPEQLVQRKIMYSAIVREPFTIVDLQTTINYMGGEK